MDSSKLDKKYMIILIVLFSMIILILSVFINIKTIEIIQYEKNNNIIFNCNGNEYLEACNDNIDRISSDLYESYQNYILTDDENTKNVILKKYIIMGDINSYIFPKEVRVIYEDETPIIFIINDHINECYLISDY